jgi:hypothetical protein
MRWFRPLNEGQKEEPLCLLVEEELCLVLSLGKKRSFSFCLGVRLPSFSKNVPIYTFLLNEGFFDPVLRWFQPSVFERKKSDCRTLKSAARKPMNHSMSAYIENQPPGSRIVPPKFQLRGKGGVVLDTLQPPELGFVLDRSSSMSSLVNEAVTGFNTLIDEQRAVASSAKFSLSLFNNDVRLLYDAVPIAEVPSLTSAAYDPSGGTALNDAIAAMIQRIGKRAKRSTRVLIAILTDGCENSSHEFSQDDLMRMVAYRRTTYDWQFIFTGPEGALPYALSIGIPKANVVAFNADPAGIRQIMERLSKSMRAYQLGDRRYALKLRN